MKQALTREAVSQLNFLKEIKLQRGCRTILKFKNHKKSNYGTACRVIFLMLQSGRDEVYVPQEQ